MARKISDIQSEIASALHASLPDLSTSAVAGWRLIAYVVAVAIHAFEVILDQFKAEMDAVADKITPGTARWYAEQCRRFQNNHELLFDDRTAELYYAVDDPAARIINIVAVTEGNNRLSIKVAKLDEQNRIVPLTADELYNFTGYVDSVKFAGMETATVSTSADMVRYTMAVYFDPAIPVTAVREAVLSALDTFRTSLDFNSMLYCQRLIDAVMSVKGVVTVDLQALERRGASMADFATIGVVDELESGYFDFDDGCTLTLTSVNALR